MCCSTVFVFSIGFCDLPAEKDIISSTSGLFISLQRLFKIHLMSQGISWICRRWLPLEGVQSNNRAQTTTCFSQYTLPLTSNVYFWIPSFKIQWCNVRTQNVSIFAPLLFNKQYFVQTWRFAPNEVFGIPCSLLNYATTSMRMSIF